MQGYPPLHRVVGVELGVLANPMELVGNAWYSPCMLGTLLVGAFRSPFRRSSLPCRTFGLGSLTSARYAGVAQILRSEIARLLMAPPLPAAGRKLVNSRMTSAVILCLLLFTILGVHVCVHEGGGGLQY